MLKTKSPADAAANGQTSPADDTYKPQIYPRGLLPCYAGWHICKRVQCETIRSQADGALPVLLKKRKRT